MCLGCGRVLWFSYTPFVVLVSVLKQASKQGGASCTFWTFVDFIFMSVEIPFWLSLDVCFDLLSIYFHSGFILIEIRRERGGLHSFSYEAVWLFWLLLNHFFSKEIFGLF